MKNIATMEMVAARGGLQVDELIDYLNQEIKRNNTD